MTNKKGGAFEYTKQFNYPLSPCYQQADGKPIFKAGWHSGGSKCGVEPSVSEMGIVNTPSNNKPTASEVAWENRYSSQSGGKNKIVLNKFNNLIKDAKHMDLFILKGNKDGGKYKLSLLYKKNNQKPYKLTVQFSGRVNKELKKMNFSEHEYSNIKTLKNKLRTFNLDNVSQVKSK